MITNHFSVPPHCILFLQSFGCVASVAYSGAREGSHHLHQQDRGLPCLPEQGGPRLWDSQRKELGDEYPGTSGWWWLCKCVPVSFCACVCVCKCVCLLTLSIVLHVPQREFPVPEQFKTVWDGSKLVTEPTEIAGWSLLHPQHHHPLCFCG